jgi:hypothetical protein
MGISLSNNPFFAGFHIRRRNDGPSAEGLHLSRHSAVSPRNSAKKHEKKSIYTVSDLRKALFRINSLIGANISPFIRGHGMRQMSKILLIKSSVFWPVCRMASLS